ncbi:4-hydroxy-tetrahydrodipicolinate reductase [Polynucleobacter sp. MWH-Loch1C5]|nr:4-hydroxy-tetrahydrodipicolinate reductase [Polynucleobacter sp. MWH-Loch1C5]
MTLKFAIAGASGRMGRMLIETVLATPDAKLVGALDLPSSSQIGQDPGAFLGQQTGIKITADLKAGMQDADYLIDFTRPEGTLEHLKMAQELGVKMIIGTTGFTEAQKQELKKASEKIAIVFAPNMSVGVNATFKLLEVAAKILNSGYDIEIVEAHHKHKVDAPSGTALGMGEAITKALGQNLQDVAVYAREGHTGERKPGTIGFATIRGGDIVGDHTVMFCGDGERIEISHKSASRMSYAQGSVRAARFLEAQSRGLFDMQDVLGLKTLKI